MRDRLTPWRNTGKRLPVLLLKPITPKDQGALGMIGDNLGLFKVISPKKMSQAKPGTTKTSYRFSTQVPSLSCMAIGQLITATAYKLLPSSALDTLSGSPNSW